MDNDHPTETNMYAAHINVIWKIRLNNLLMLHSGIYFHMWELNIFWVKLFEGHKIKLSKFLDKHVTSCCCCLVVAWRMFAGRVGFEGWLGAHQLGEVFFKCPSIIWADEEEEEEAATQKWHDTMTQCYLDGNLSSIPNRLMEFINYSLNLCYLPTIWPL